MKIVVIGGRHLIGKMDKRTALQHPMPDGESDFALVPSAARGSVLPERVPCHVCQHEIPTSEALSTEATDYVLYFCGLDCYERWRNESDGH
jgi:Domain of unknown function (DUF3330)